jgi:hypothetical protein
MKLKVMSQMTAGTPIEEDTETAAQEVAGTAVEETTVGNCD